MRAPGLMATTGSPWRHARSMLISFIAGAVAVGASLVTATPTPAAADPGVNVYTTPGEHTVNGRQWRTACEKYTTTIHRCRAEIWATQIRARTGGGYEAVNGWAFNNLTYLPSGRALWQGNPLASDGTFTSEGRRWRTSCGDDWTGPNACRSFIWATTVESYLDPVGNRRYRPVNQWLFNNIVQFGTTTTPPEVTQPRGCTITVDGITVDLAADRRTATVARTRGTRATVTMVERTPGTSCGTRTVFSDTTGWIGYAGTAPAATRKQDSGTTPAGVFTVNDAFGIRATPGTNLSWRDVGPDSYWVLDNASAHYNQWRQGSAGGFNKKVSERLAGYPGQYNYVAVIDYNRNPAVRGKGGAIFLHVHGKGATEGCVSITEENMKTFLRTVAAGDTITIQ